MKPYSGKIGKWLLIAVFIFASGGLYSCSGQGQTELLTAEERTEAKIGWESAEETDEETGASEMLTEPESETERCFVYVCGAIQNAGVYTLEKGQRIYEAIALAGGMTDKAAEETLNLAAEVSDGMKIYVPDQDEAQNFQTGSEPLADAKVNLNTATKEELMTLRGIGESRAEDIIRYRETHGSFQTIEEIMKVSGIKDAAFQKIKDKIIV